MYEIGRVYVWQNQVGPFACLNGKETTVIGPLESHWQYPTRIGQRTDTLDPTAPGVLHAEHGDLRPKNDPKGERGIMDLFKLPELAY